MSLIAVKPVSDLLEVDTTLGGLKSTKLRSRPTDQVLQGFYHCQCYLDVKARIACVAGKISRASAFVLAAKPCVNASSEAARGVVVKDSL